MDQYSAFSYVGVGLRHPHLQYFEKNSNQVSWLEIHSENYFNQHSSERATLHQIAQSTDISCHGIGLSLGSVSPVNRHHLSQLKALVDELNPMLISDHLSWSEHNGHHFNDLLPLPYTEEALEVFCRNVEVVQNELQRPLLIENPSSYLRFKHSTISEWEFLNEVQKRTQCRLLLDLNNIHVSAFNHGYDVHTYLNGIDASCVDEIHLAGFTKKYLPSGEIWIDTHSTFVSDEVWQMYQQWCVLHGPVKTLIEWDLDIPPADVLLEEASKAIVILEGLEISNAGGLRHDQSIQASA
jgi:uncharacterized protein (UPF0276 family)